jgi:hypothetical protein
VVDGLLTWGVLARGVQRDYMRFCQWSGLRVLLRVPYVLLADMPVEVDDHWQVKAKQEKVQ